jgi:hypothetical protein
MQSFLLGLSFALPHINNVFFSELVKTSGVYASFYLLLSQRDLEV